MQQQQPAQQQQGQRGSNWTGMIFRMMMFYFLFNYFFKPKPTTEQVDSTGKTLPVVYNIWKEGTRFDLRVYFTESENFTEYEDNSKLVWITEDIYYDWRESNSRKISFDYIPTPTLLNNGSLFAHVFFTRSGFPYNPKSQKYDKTASFHETHPMTKYLLQKKDVRKNLISGDSDLTKEELEKKQQQLELFQNTTMQYISFWKPNLTLNLIEDQNRYPSGSLPPQFQQHMRINEQFGWFYPVIYFNEFWLFREHMIPINNTIKTLPVTIEYGLIGLIKWQMMLQMEQSFQMQQQMGTSAEGESDEIKRMLIETNPYLLAVTFIVTILHSVFDFLAFKNDIHFWKNKKNLEGMSVKTIFINTISQFIIFLYLIDNETSWIIIISAGIGLLIECWKVKKAVIVTIDWNKTIPIVFTDRESYASKTKEYDEQAMKYLSYLLFPLIVGYSIYSLMYQTHKSWYSWIISSLVGCVYTFGFIMMTPQLFINYKLKSVAHLPWRVFTYKALNTFIDDLFAFIIKMPTMHRLSCFRDDIIFLIYLYQRWTYRVDPTRVNEFGQSGLDDLLNNDNNDSNANDNVSAENDKTIKDKEEEETQNHGENEKEAEIKPADEKKKD